MNSEMIYTSSGKNEKWQDAQTSVLLQTNQGYETCWNTAKKMAAETCGISRRNPWRTKKEKHLNRTQIKLHYSVVHPVYWVKLWWERWLCDQSDPTSTVEVTAVRTPEGLANILGACFLRVKKINNITNGSYRLDLSARPNWSGWPLAVLKLRFDLRLYRGFIHSLSLMESG